MRIAFLEDDAEQAGRIVMLLEARGHQLRHFDRGSTLLRELRTESYDLIVLDWEVPDLSGLDVLRALRERQALHTPVLFLTHRDEEIDIVEALESGADDYLVKPPRERELLSRVMALGRRARAATEAPDCLEVGPFSIDFAKRSIARAAVPIELTRREFDVAALLFRNVGKVLSRGHIFATVWGGSDSSSTRTVDMHVSRLRAALGLSAAIGVRLTPVYGYGYRLERTGADRND